MTFTIRRKYKLKMSLIFILLGFGAGLFFVVLNDGLESWYPIINGIIIGTLIGLVTALFEFFLNGKWLKQRSLPVIICLRTLYYSMMISGIIILEIGVARMITDRLTLAELLVNPKFNAYVFDGEYVTSIFYAMALVFFVNFNLQISRKLGNGVLLSLITGRYHRPREIEKVFLFLTVPNARQIIHKIGRMRFHNFINEVIYDITDPIIARHGVIYHYVDNEMVIKWDKESGIRNANAILCFFEVKAKLVENSDFYLKKYSVAPEINGAIHMGPVVKGEIGLMRSEIVYHGDTMNTTSRILEKCKALSTDVIASSHLLDLIKLPADLAPKKCDDVLLKGKGAPVGIYSIQQTRVHRAVNYAI